MIPHFTLQRGKQEYLIIRMGDEFHIIDCNEALTKEKRLAVLESGCTPAGMQEMGLSGMTIPKSDIRALTVTGCGFQDDVIFYLNKKKLTFWFPKAYEQRKVDDFFRGIPRKMVKTRRRLKHGKNMDWRDREGNPETARKMRPVGWVLNGLGGGMFVLPMVVRLPLALWMGIVTALCLTAIALDIFFPEYFSMLFEGKKERREREGKATHLGLGLIAALYPLLIRLSVTIHLFDEIRVLPAALLMTVVVGAVLFLFCREFREEWGQGLATVAVVFLFCWTVFVPYFNYALGPEPEPVTAAIVDQNRNGGKHPSFYCDVLLPDGRELKVEVSRSEYNAYETGDNMELRVGTGAFGIEYAIDN